MKSKLLSAITIIAAVAAVLSLGLNAQRVSDVAIIRLRVDDIERRLGSTEHAPTSASDASQLHELERRLSAVAERVAELEKQAK